MRKLAWIAAWALVAGSALGCVKKSEYEAKVAEAATCQANLDKTRGGYLDLESWAAQESHRATSVQATLDARTARANRDLGELQKQLDDATALNSSLREALQKKGEDVDKLLQEKGTLATSLEQARSRLEELRRAQAAAERRAETMRQLVEQFRKMADAGQLKVVVRRGRMVLQLPSEVLFDPGRAELRPQGKAALAEVARVLKTMPGRQFQVAGHTDDVPISTAKYPSNWYLSATRAIHVVDFLIKDGMDPHTLSAAGYGQFDPIAPNDTPEDKAKNRRIEIVIQPNVDELMAVEGTGGW